MTGVESPVTAAGRWVARHPTPVGIGAALAAGYAVSVGHIFDLARHHGQTVWTAALIAALPELQVAIGVARAREATRDHQPNRLGPLQAGVLGVYAVSGLVLSAAANLATVRAGQWPVGLATWLGWDAVMAGYPVWAAFGAILLWKIPAARARRRRPSVERPPVTVAPSPAPVTAVRPPLPVPVNGPRHSGPVSDGGTRQTITAALGDGPVTVPELVVVTGRSRRTVIGHLDGMGAVKGADRRYRLTTVGGAP